MRKRLLAGILVLAGLLAACTENSDHLLLENSTKNMLTDIIGIHLTNVPYEVQASRLENYRTRMDFTVWDNHFDLAYDRVKYELAIAESYHLVPHTHQVKELLMETTETGGIHYTAIVELTALLENSTEVTTDTTRQIYVFYYAEFDASGVLMELKVAHKQGGGGGAL